jgi:plastocyanin
MFPTFTEYNMTNMTNETVSATTAMTSSNEVQVSILPNAGTDTTSTGFSLDNLVVVIGVNNTVIWTNNDNMPHTVTSTSGAFHSGNMAPDQTFTYTFTSPGTYNYVCSYHSWMKGTVTVLSSS